jgi:hypothetical protein
MATLSRSRSPSQVNSSWFRPGPDQRPHVLTPEDRRLAGLRSRANLQPFRRGYDPRRHIFTREECSRGGRISWAKTMVRLRRDMNLRIDRHIAALANI